MATSRIATTGSTKLPITLLTKILETNNGTSSECTELLVHIKVSSVVYSNIYIHLHLVIGFAADDTNARDSSLSSNTTITNSAPVATDVFTLSVVIGIITAILIVLTATVISVLVLFRRKSAQQKPDCDGSYSTLNRENTQQMLPQSLHTPAKLYDQIQLSPSTGQTEFVSKPDSENINNSSLPNSHNIYPSVGTELPTYPNSAISQITSSNISPHDVEETTSKQPTYAVIDKTKKRKEQIRGKESAISQYTEAEENGDPPPLYNPNTDHYALQQGDQPKQRQDIHGGKYAVVHRRPKRGKANAETPIPSHTVDSQEQLYTAVKKKSKGSAAEDEEEAPPLPSHTVEVLYTAVKKKPKGSTAKDEAAAPPLLLHTVEKFYTIVQKNDSEHTS